MRYTSSENAVKGRLTDKVALSCFMPKQWALRRNSLRGRPLKLNPLWWNQSLNTSHLSLELSQEISSPFFSSCASSTPSVSGPSSSQTSISRLSNQPGALHLALTVERGLLGYGSHYPYFFIKRVLTRQVGMAVPTAIITAPGAIRRCV